jgi:hypothetical protein
MDIRPFHLLWEHKRVMVRRINKLIEEGYLPSNFNILDFIWLQDTTLILRNSLLKYNLTRNVGMIEDLIKKIVAVKQQDINSLTMLNELLMKYHK